MQADDRPHGRTTPSAQGGPYSSVMRRFIVTPLVVGVASAALMAITASSSDASAARLRVVTFNIHLGEALIEERDGGHRSLARAFREEADLTGVDVLALQELCAGEGGWQLRYFQRLFRERGAVYTALAYADPSHASPDPNIGPPCDRAEVILSRFPIVASGTIELPAVREPRSAVWADLELPGRVLLRVYNPHLENRVVRGSSEEGRLRQMEHLLAHLDAWRAEHPDAPVLVLGDFNSTAHPWNPFYREKALRALEGRGMMASMTEHSRTLTWLPYQIDWVYSAGLRLQNSHVVDVWLSDHFPVVADFERPSR